MPRETPNRDAALLWDMLTYARSVCQSLERVSLEQYVDDENLRLATERRIEIIGEAARRVSASFQSTHPNIPWRSIIAQRHVLAHDYGEIQDELIWRVVKMNLPPLMAQLEPIVARLESQGGS